MTPAPDIPPGLRGIARMRFRPMQAFQAGYGADVQEVARLAAEAARDRAAPPAELRRLMSWWYALGWPAFAGVIAIFGLMVFKPALW